MNVAIPPSFKTALHHSTNLYGRISRASYFPVLFDYHHSRGPIVGGMWGGLE